MQGLIHLRSRGLKLLKRMNEQKMYLLMLLPGMVYYLIFKYYPVVYGMALSVVKFNLRRGLSASKLLDPWYYNFEFFFSSPYFEQLMINTLVISALKIVIGIPFAVMLAVFLFECRNKVLRRLVQTFTYMPHFLSWVVIYGMCQILFSDSSGLITDIVTRLTGNKIKVFSSIASFRWLIILSDIWKSTGWSAILYLAAISGIDPSLYESAVMDGCSRVKSIWYITLPSIVPVITLTAILRIGSILEAGFDQIFIMYNPLVRPGVDIIDTWVYRTGLESMNISLASAVGLFKSFVGIVLVVSANALARKWEGSMW